MDYTFWLPTKNGKSKYKINTNVLMIIGPNGSGKSNLGSWIVKNSNGHVFRVKGYSKEICESHGKKKSDFYNVLNNLIEKKNYENDKYVADCKACVNAGCELPDLPNTVIDKIINIWPIIFPKHKLEVVGSTFYVVTGSRRYSVSQMGDGERAVLYIAAQVLGVPRRKTIVIDDPEAHMNRYLSNVLWKQLERIKNDSLFIYITHDTQFASSQTNCEKIWIKEYNGKFWEFERLVGNELPEDLLLDILGSRNNVLFVEGEGSSYDTQLYSILYPQYKVVPCGGCSTVISRAKMFKENANQYNVEVYGLIDRDFRTEEEIEELKAYNVYVIDVAEVENLFLVEELIRFLAKHLGKDPDIVFRDVKNYVIDVRFKNQLNEQIYKSIVSEIRYRLSIVEVSKKTGTDVDEILDNITTVLNSKEIKQRTISKFNNACNNRDYREVIKIFNEKNISATVGKFFGLNNNAYCSTVINLLNSENRQELVRIFKKYLPDEILR